MKKNNIELWIWRMVFAAALIYFGITAARGAYWQKDDECKKIALANYDLSISLREANKTIDSLRANEQYFASQAELLRNEKIILEKSLNDVRQRFSKEEVKFANSQQRLEELQIQVFYLNQAIKNLLELN